MKCLILLLLDDFRKSICNVCQRISVRSFLLTFCVIQNIQKLTQLHPTKRLVPDIQPMALQ